VIFPSKEANKNYSATKHDMHSNVNIPPKMLFHPNSKIVASYVFGEYARFNAPGLSLRFYCCQSNATLWLVQKHVAVKVLSTGHFRPLVTSRSSSANSATSPSWRRPL